MATVTGSVVGGDWNTNGAWLLGSQPTANDDVVLIGTSGPINIPAAVTAICKSLDCTGFTSSLTFAATTSALTIGNATGGACTFVNTMTLVLTGIGTINFVASQASTTFALTTAGLVMPNLTVNVGSTTTIQFADNVTATGATLTLTAGKWDWNGKTVVAAKFLSTGSGARTLTMGASAVTLTATGSLVWNYDGNVNLTITANTAVLTLSGASAQFGTGNKNYNGASLVFTGGSSPQISGGGTYAAITVTGGANKTGTFTTVTLGFTCTGTFTVTGASAINRVLCSSNVVGTTHTWTAAAISLTNCDFQDITGAGLAANAAWTGTSMGDCQGNSNITFDAPATQTHTASAGGNWSDATKWTSRVPLPQDDVVVNGSTTGTLTNDMPRCGKSLTFTGFAGTCNIASVASSNFGSITLATGMTVSQTTNLTMAARTSVTLTSATKSFGATVVISGPGGTVTLLDNFSIVTGVLALQVNDGTFDAAGFNVAVDNFASVSGRTRVINMGAGTWTIFGTTATTKWNVTAAGLTLNGSAATIVFSVATSNARTFAGAGFTYGTLTYTVAGSTGQLTITGSNTFSTINFSDASNARTLQFTSGTTNTITTFNVFGTSGKNMTVSAVTAASFASLVSTTSWYVGANSTSVSGNTGITLAAGTTMDYLTVQDIHALGNISGAGAITGTGTVAAVGQRTVFGSMALTGTGVLAMSGAAVPGDHRPGSGAKGGFTGRRGPHGFSTEELLAQEEEELVLLFF